MNVGFLINFLVGFLAGKTFSFGPIAIEIDGQKLTASGTISVNKA